MDSIKGLFFDLDGTLVDTLDANVHAYQKALAEVGRKITKEQLSEVFGMRYDTFLRKFFPDISDEDIQKVRQLKGDYYPEFLHLSKPHKELIGFIRTLRRSHQTILVTMAQRKNAMAVLKAAGIEDLFDYIVSGEDVVNAKPHPESYLHALELTGLKPEDALAFEDSESGIAAAQAAGIATLKITIPGEDK